MRVDGSNVLRLTHYSAHDSFPIWSPDGTKIAFVPNRNTDEQPDVDVMDADGDNQLNLTNSLRVWE